jgi:hypothetical protein
MKKVKALWIPTSKSMEEIEEKDYITFLQKYKFIGFELEKISSDLALCMDRSSRYMIVRTGQAFGLAVNPFDTNGDINYQRTCNGKYFVFETYTELLDWMKG